MAEPRVLFAAFEDPRQARHAVEALQALGHARVEVFGPHADPELERRLAPRPSRLPLLAGGLGLGAAAMGYLLQLWTAHDYPLAIAGFEQLKVWPYIPLTFISGILATGLIAVVGFVLAERLPRLHATAAEERCLAAVGHGAWVLRLAFEREVDVEAAGDAIADHAPLWSRVVEVEP